MISKVKRGNAVFINEVIENLQIEDLEQTEDRKFGPELIDEVIKEPTLDIYLDRSPKLNQLTDYEEMVTILQRKRAAFITAEQKKKEPKIDGEDNG